ncbi:MAG TPA: hypothetical protein VLA44_03885 [Clostridia bacterium]|nr:hypothetical protein [Clostridia bacterium]
MIVVIGQPVLRTTPAGAHAAGMAAVVAAEAARRGATVQLIGKVGEDRAGEEVVLALARDGIGHVALLRDPYRQTPRLVAESVAEPDEVELDDDAGLPVERLDPADPAQRPAFDAGDLELGLRYLTEFGVLVATEPLDDALARVVADAAGWSGATLIAVAARDGGEPPGLPPAAIVLVAPEADPDDVFGRLVGSLAASIDSGTEPGAAFRDIVAAAGWEPAET